MASERQVEAYRKRLAKIAGKGAAMLTSECLGAVASVEGSIVEGRGIAKQKKVVGTLVSYQHAHRLGMFGLRIITNVTVCTACVHQRAQCAPRDLRTVTDVILLDLVRNDERGEDHA